LAERHYYDYAALMATPDAPEKGKEILNIQDFNTCVLHTML